MKQEITTSVLIDYYNLPYQLLNGGILSLGNRLAALVHSCHSDTSDIDVRLYGGWYDDKGLSNDGTRLSQQISSGFPIVSRQQDGITTYVRCEIASSLVSLRKIVFFATIREKHGLDRFAPTARPPHCLDPVRCAISTVIGWSRRGCPISGCPVASNEAFISRQQKLVDVLLCCDLLTLAEKGKSARLFVVSEDDDFIPALFQARTHGAIVWHVRTKLTKTRMYDALLQTQGVNVISI